MAGVRVVVNRSPSRRVQRRFGQGLDHGCQHEPVLTIRLKHPRVPGVHWFFVCVFFRSVGRGHAKQPFEGSTQRDSGGCLQQQGRACSRGIFRIALVTDLSGGRGIYQPTAVEILEEVFLSICGVELSSDRQQGQPRQQVVQTAAGSW